jgi:hypothetical protein
MERSLTFTVDNGVAQSADGSSLWILHEHVEEGEEIYIGCLDPITCPKLVKLIFVSFLVVDLFCDLSTKALLVCKWDLYCVNRDIHKDTSMT